MNKFGKLENVKRNYVMHTGGTSFFNLFVRANGLTQHFLFSDIRALFENFEV